MYVVSYSRGDDLFIVRGGYELRGTCSIWRGSQAAQQGVQFVIEELHEILSSDSYTLKVVIFARRIQPMNFPVESWELERTVVRQGESPGCRWGVSSRSSR